AVRARFIRIDGHWRWRHVNGITTKRCGWLNRSTSLITAAGDRARSKIFTTPSVTCASTNFVATAMAGASTLSDDAALGWFTAISARVTLGSTHCLAGSANNYVTFLQRVAASNAVPFHPEVHNVCEAIIGANYGLKGVVWWGTAERARGDFVKACQGQR